MYIYLYINIYSCINMYIYVHIHTYINIYLSIYLSIYTNEELPAPTSPRPASLIPDTRDSYTVNLKAERVFHGNWPVNLAEPACRLLIVGHNPSANTWEVGVAYCTS